MRIVLLAVALLGFGVAPAAACPWNPSYISHSVEPLPPGAFAEVSTAMSMPEIIERLGPAARDVGSGLYVLQWNVTDGRTFHVSTDSACGKPLGVGFHESTSGRRTLQPAAAD